MRTFFLVAFAIISISAIASCAKPLYTIPRFLSLMKRNGFTLVKENPDMSGYPVYGFALSTE